LPKREKINFVLCESYAINLVKNFKSKQRKLVRVSDPLVFNCNKIARLLSDGKEELSPEDACKVFKGCVKLHPLFAFLFKKSALGLPVSSDELLEFIKTIWPEEKVREVTQSWRFTT
jgi:hypothetical protein